MSEHPVRLGALRHRNFRLFYTGYVVSLIGVWMQRVAQSWLVLDLTDSAFWVGLVDALGTLPVLFLSLYAGTVADRVSKHRMVLTTQAAGMVLGLALAALVFADVITVWLIVVIATLMGVVAAFDIPARQAFYVDLVGKEDLTNAIALNSAAFNGSRIVGPAIAGILIGIAGVAICFLLNGLSFIAVIVALVLMDLPRYQRPEGPRISPWESILEGLRYVFADRRMRTLVINIAVLSIFGIPVLVLLPVIARDVLGLGAREFGWMMSSVGVGALLGALAIAIYARRLHRGRLLGWATVCFGAAVAATALARPFAVVLALLALVGVSMIVASAITNTLLQALAPDHLRGRVVSVYTFAFVGMAPIGALQAGVVAERFGPQAALLMGGLVIAAVVLLTVVRSGVLREER